MMAPPAPLMRISRGTRFGRYEVRASLGAGGMGEVYLAHDTTLGRSVAIKLLPESLADDPERVRRMEHEAHAASTLNHPNILTVHEIGFEAGRPFIVTEYVEGASLRQRMQQGDLTLRDSLAIGAQLASALAAAHAVGIVHRDIKPENIMLRPDGIVKVLDFGLAKTVDREGRSAGTTQTLPNHVTRPGVVLGTLHYMSPEQSRGLPTDPRTDIWSLGVVLYELVAGRSPFQGTTGGDVIAAILKTEPPPLSRYSNGVPSELERIVRKAIEKDRNERYQAIQDLGLDLKALGRRLAFDAERAREESSVPVIDEAIAPMKVVTGRTVDPARIPAAPPRSRLTAPTRSGLAALLLVAAIGGVLYWYVGRPGVVADGGSVAVLPFTNESTSPDTEYLSDGISAALINSLSRLSGLRVIARTSTFKYKNKEIDFQDVGRALSVGVVVTGHLAQLGDRLRIGVELVDVATGAVIWGDQYDRRTGDLQQLQAEISREIATRLRPALTAAERDRLGKPETSSQQAYDLVLRGRFYFDKGGTQNRWTAIEHYQKALAIDPDYPLAHVGLSRAYGYMIFLSVVSPQEYKAKMEAAARKALELDPNLAEAHTAMAMAKRFNWDWVGVEQSFKHALALNLNLPDAHDGYAGLLTIRGRHDEAIAESRLAQQLDPLSVVLNSRLGFTLFFARRFNEAIEVLDRSRAMDPSSSVTHLFLGYTHAAAGRFADAVAAYDEAIRLGDDSASAQIYLGAAYAGLGQRDRAQEILRRLETSASYVSPGELAVLQAALGQRDRAFASLAAALVARDVQLTFLGIDPAYDSLRGDPRFAQLLRATGLQGDDRDARR